MKWRKLILLFGALMACPVYVHAQQTALPKIGFLGSRWPVESEKVLAAFRQGLKEAGFIGGQNVKFEFRWAEGDYDRLPALATELVHDRVAVITTAGGNVAAHAAKTATASIPIVFISNGDPVRDGLVASLNRPGGNVTGVNILTTELEPKRIELLRELVPNSSAVGVLVNPMFTEATTDHDLPGGAHVLGLKMVILRAHTKSSIEAAFAAASEQRLEALLVASDPFFLSQRQLIVGLAKSYRVPTIYSVREFVDSGGLMSYGTSLSDAYHLVGDYTGRILKGAKPDDLPVQQLTTFELVINLTTAKALGLTIPPSLLAHADEVIE
jgi:putative ABC transport system substrate-binding protein